MAFDVDEWWNTLDKDDQTLALHWRDIDPLPNKVIERLNGHGVMYATGPEGQPASDWHWTAEVRHFLKRMAGDADAD